MFPGMGRPLPLWATRSSVSPLLSFVSVKTSEYFSSLQIWMIVGPSEGSWGTECFWKADSLSSLRLYSQFVKGQDWSLHLRSLGPVWWVQTNPSLWVSGVALHSDGSGMLFADNRRSHLHLNAHKFKGCTNACCVCFSSPPCAPPPPRQHDKIILQAEVGVWLTVSVWICTLSSAFRVHLPLLIWKVWKMWLFYSWSTGIYYDWILARKFWKICRIATAWLGDVYGLFPGVCSPLSMKRKYPAAHLQALQIILILHKMICFKKGMKFRSNSSFSSLRFICV